MFQGNCYIITSWKKCQEKVSDPFVMIPPTIMQYCADHHLAMTPIRQILLDALWCNKKPFKAYDLIEVLRENAIGSPKPPTVYRAIEFLEQHGLVHKLHSLNAYLPCHHPGIHKNCQFLICDTCAQAEEFCDHTLSTMIPASARNHGFHPRASFVEVFGVCHQCQVVV